MLLVKALHIIFVVTWFAGLFYLPRLFVYHCNAHDRTSTERFEVMESKLFAMMTLGGIAAATFGLWLWWGYGATPPWLQAKLALVVVLIGYHIYCGKLVRDFKLGRNRRGHVYYRWFNELPALLLVGVVLLAVMKPF